MKPAITLPDNQNLRIVCIGEAMVELSLPADDEISLGFAGDTLNTAIYLKRLFADTAHIAYCTVLGTDPLSDKLVSFIQSESIDTSTVQRTDERCVGIYSISTDSTGERSFNYWRDNSAAKTLFTAGDFSALEQYDVIYLSAITLAILPDSVRHNLLDTLARMRQTSKTLIAFDSNYRPALWDSQTDAQAIIEQAWKITDIALPSVDDELAIFNEADEAAVIKRFAEYQVPAGALKRGATGPFGFNLQTQPATEYPTVETVIDSTAAGDSFNAGFLHAYLNHQEPAEALLAGHNCAATVIQYPGAIVPMEKWRS